MSIWSKLGLADAESIAALQSELAALRAENARLQEELSDQNRQIFSRTMDELEKGFRSVEGAAVRLCERVEAMPPVLSAEVQDCRAAVTAAGEAVRERMDQQTEILRQGQEGLKILLSGLGEQQQKLEAGFHAALAAQQEREDALRAELSAAQRESVAVTEELRRLHDRIGTMDQGPIKELLEKQKKQGERLGAVQAAVDNIAPLREYTESLCGYTNSLWEAMKLVWINDLIDDCKQDLN